MTVTEVLVASAIMAGTSGAVFTLLAPAQAAFRAQPEVADLQQRMRVAIDALTRDVMAAGVILPRRAGRMNPDPPAAVFDDRITLVFTDAAGGIRGSRTYSLRNDPAAGAWQLMQYDGNQSELPLVDGVVRLAFEYVGAPRIRLVRVTLRLRMSTAAPRGNVPEWEVQFSVAPRALWLQG